MRRSISLILFVQIALVFAITLPARAEEATQPGTRDIPGADECTVAPGSKEEIRTLFRELAATPPADEEEADPEASFVPPDGEPADDDVIATTEAAVRELIACTNRYGFLGLVPLSTERHIADVLRFDISLGVTEDMVADFLFATPDPSAQDQAVALVDVRDVTILPDGRIGCVVVGDEAGVGQVPLYFIFVQDGDRFLVDEQFDLETNATPES